MPGSPARGLALAAGGADLGVGDLVGEQGVDLGGLGGGVAEAAAHNLDGDAAVDQFGGVGVAELINSGVSIEVVRRRLGHASTETTQVYTLLADKVADAEVRAARRRRDRAAR